MGPAKKGTKGGKGARGPYQEFFQRELKRIKQENPTMSSKDAFKQAGLNWRTSSENPKNQDKEAAPASAASAAAGSASKEKVPAEKPTLVPAPASVPAGLTAPASEPKEPVAPVCEPAAPVREPLAPTAPASTLPAPPCPLSGSDVLDGAKSVTDEPKTSGGLSSVFGKGGIPTEHGGLGAKASSPAPATSGAAAHSPSLSSKAAARTVAPAIPSMAAHTVPGALTAAK